MKKILLSTVLFLFVVTAFCQEQKNGTIYIKHPYIEVVNQATRDYLADDFSKTSNYYADSAMWWISGMSKFVPLAEALKLWKGDFDKFDDIRQEPNGYPDFLHYIKDNTMIVQSWWTWSGKSKKTGEVTKVRMVMFDEFNVAGKITREYIFGDFSKLANE